MPRQVTSMLRMVSAKAAMLNLLEDRGVKPIEGYRIEIEGCVIDTDAKTITINYTFVPLPTGDEAAEEYRLGYNAGFAEGEASARKYPRVEGS